MEPLSQSEGLLVSRLQELFERLIKTDRSQLKRWSNNKDVIVGDKLDKIWDIGDVTRVYERYWSFLKNVLPNIDKKNEHEILNIIKVVRDMRNRFRHNPGIQISQFDIIAFCSLCRYVLLQINSPNEARCVGEIMMNVRIHHINFELEKILNFRNEYRSKIFDNAKSYYSTDFDVGFMNLIHKAEWIPNNPIKLSNIDEKLRWKDTESEYPSGILQPLYNKKLLSSCIRDNMEGIYLYNGPTYRLVDLDTSGGIPSLCFEKSDYFKYVDFNESLAIELATFTRENTRAPAFDRNDLPYRGDPKRALNLSNNGCAVGINAITVIARRSSKKFILHARGVNTLEAQNTLHVVPAGTFQPHSIANSSQPRDFSLVQCISREFVEELLGTAEAEGHERNGDDILNHQNASVFRRLILEDSVDFLYMGVGVDLVNLKPEILACIVINDYNDELRFKDNFEGDGYLEDWNSQNLLRCSRDLRMLPAGSACLFLAAKHFSYIDKML